MTEFNDETKTIPADGAALKIFETARKVNGEVYDKLIAAEAKLKTYRYEITSLTRAINENCKECSKDECTVGSACFFWKWSPFNIGSPKGRRKYVKK